MTADVDAGEIGALVLDEALARSLQRAVARKALSNLRRKGDPALRRCLRDIDEPTWASPDAVWNARVPLSPSMATFHGTPADHFGLSSDFPVWNEYSADIQSVPSWTEWTLARLDREARALSEQKSGVAIAPAPEPVELATYCEGASRISGLWPEAWREMEILVRAIVHVEGRSMYSASPDEAFGAILLGAVCFGSTSAIAETLLHESAHVSLFLRSYFTSFIDNDSELASHPLRDGDRPLSGVLHAAFSLARITAGMQGFVQNYPDDEEARSRWLGAGDDLIETLEVLMANARWTLDGQRICETLVQVADEYRAARPPGEPIESSSVRRSGEWYRSRQPEGLAGAGARFAGLGNLWLNAEGSSTYRDAYLRVAPKLHWQLPLACRYLEEFDIPTQATVLDVGTGHGEVAAYFVRTGRSVVALDIDESMLGAFRGRFEVNDPPFEFIAADGGDWCMSSGRRFDVVCAHSVLMYEFDAPRFIMSLANAVARDGILSITAITPDAVAMRPALQGFWAEAEELLAADVSRTFVPSSGFLRSRETVIDILSGCGLQVVGWQGLGVFDGHPHLIGEAKLGREVEYLAGLNDPYRSVARCFHLVARWSTPSCGSDRGE